MHEDLEVHKFGGSCLRDGTDLERIANILLDRSGEAILAAALVDVSSARLRERASLPTDERATSAAVDVSATAAPARLVMYSRLCQG